MKRSVALLFIALVAGCTRATVHDDRSEPRASARSPRDAVDAMDQDVIAQLRNNGSDVTKPTDVVHYLYIPVRGDAQDAARRSGAAGYRAVVHEPLGQLPNGTFEKRYSVEARKTSVPSIENIRHARAFFEAVARRYHGEYDGWEAAVAK